MIPIPVEPPIQRIAIDSLPLIESSSSLVDLLSALLTPAIAIVVALILYQQLRLEKRRHKLEAYNRRLDIYKAVIRFVSVATAHARVDEQHLAELSRGTFVAPMLFDDEVVGYVQEIRKNGISLMTSGQQMESLQQNDDRRSQAVEQNHEALTWLGEQYEAAESLFRKKMGIK